MDRLESTFEVQEEKELHTDIVFCWYGIRMENDF